VDGLSLREKELSMLRGDQEVDEANIDDGQVYDSGKDNDSSDDEDKRPKGIPNIYSLSLFCSPVIIIYIVFSSLKVSE
jgi:hypothetical protein